MAILKDFMNAIESSGFSARINVASNLKTFKRAVASEEAFRLRAQAMQDEEAALEIVARALRLCRLVVDMRYEHPSDSAIAAYLLALTAYPSHAKIVAIAARTAPNCFWAKQVAESILDTYDRSSDSELILAAVLSFETTTDSLDWLANIEGGDVQRAIENGTLAEAIDARLDSSYSDSFAMSSGVRVWGTESDSA